MPKITIINSVTRLSNLETLKLAKLIANGIDKHTDELPKIPTGSEELRNKVRFVEENFTQAKILRAKASELEQKAQKELFAIKISLKANTSYVEKVVNDTQNTSLIPALGLKTREKSGHSVPNGGVPQAVSLQEIPYTSATLKIKFKPVKGAMSYGVVWAYGATSPDTFSKQPMKIIGSSRKAILSELESGKMIWVRIKSYGSNNTESDWSDIASRIVP